MHTIYLIRNGYLRLEPDYSVMALQVNQKTYEKILGNGIFLPSCITPIDNYNKYQDGDILQAEDIPDSVEFVDIGIELNRVKKDEQSFASYKQTLLDRINNDYLEDYLKGEIYIGNDVCSYTEKDRLDMSIAVAAGLGGYYNCEYYAPSEYKQIFYAFENELARLSYYKQVLVDLTNKITYEDYLAGTQEETVWGMYTESVAERMEQFEEPFK